MATLAKLRGRVTEEGNSIVLSERDSLPVGTEVLITLLKPVQPRRGSPRAVLKAMRSQPHLHPKDVDELERTIGERRADVDWKDPLTVPATRLNERTGG